MDLRQKQESWQGYIQEYGVVTGVLVALVAITIFLVFHGQWNLDEGFYLFASQLVGEGKRPYIDFAFTQPPLSLYSNLPFLNLFGYSLFGIRVASGFWLMAGLLTTTALLLKHNRKSEAILFLFQLLIAFGWIVASMKGRNYAIAASLLLICTYLVLMQPKGIKVWFVFVSFAALAMACRYLSFLQLLPMAVLLLYEQQNWRIRFLSIIGALGLAVVLLMLMSFGDWQKFWFWTVEYHLMSHVSGERFIQLTEILRLYPMGILSIPIALILALCGRQYRNAYLLVLFIILILLNLSSTRNYGEYLSIFIPSLCLVIAFILGSKFGKFSPKILCLSALLLFAFSLWYFNVSTVYKSISWGMTNRAHEAAAFLRSQVAPESQVVAAPLEIAVEANMQIPLELAMGTFSISDTLPKSDLKALGILDYAGLISKIRDPNTKALVLYADNRGNFVWSVPTITPFPISYFTEFEKALNGFHIAYADIDYVVLLRQNDRDPSDDRSVPPKKPIEHQ